MAPDPTPPSPAAPAPAPAPAPAQVTLAAIGRLLRPAAVAVIGASDKPGALGAAVIANLDRNGFAGTVFPVNPGRATIGARPCLPSVEALPAGVDVAVLAIPRAGVVPAVRAAAARGVGACVIFAAGFAEGGPDGIAEQAEIAAVARASGMVIVGPNCLGLVSHVSATPLTFVATACMPPAGARAVGIVSQSGAMMAVLSTTLQARAVPLSHAVSTGNEAASGAEDYLEWLIADPDTHVIAMIVEQFRAPARLLAAARAAGKPIVLLHPGRSRAARESAATHTGAMAGDDRLMRANVTRAGVILAETLEELGDIAEILLRCPPFARGEIAVLGESGAFKALTLDLAEALGLPLAALTDDDSPALRAALPAFVPVSNPLDITAQGLSQPAIYTDTLAALLADARVGAVVAGIIQSDAATSAIKLPAILHALAGGHGKPLIFAGLDEGAAIPAHFVAGLRAVGVPWFPSSERALRACARLAAWVARDRDAASPPAMPVPGLGDHHGVIPEYRAKALLAPLGVPFPASEFAASAEDAVAAASALGYPVAMKAQSAQLPHKSDAGGVILRLADAAAVRAAWARMQADVAQHDRSIVLDGVLIEAMGAPGIEMIVGARGDPDWGPVVLAGFGGVTAEIHADVRLFTPDMSEAAILAELMRLQAAPLLHGYRGAPVPDVAALARLIRRISAILLAEPAIAEIDLNPVILRPDGVVALDALMVLR